MLYRSCGKEKLHRSGFALGVSQAAVSQQIRSLEADLGTELFIRHNRTFSLTEAGSYFYTHLRPLSDEYRKIIRETKRLGKGIPRSLRIGYPVNYEGAEL